MESKGLHTFLKVNLDFRCCTSFTKDFDEMSRGNCIFLLFVLDVQDVMTVENCIPEPACSHLNLLV
jgi:hypothetical protein